MKSLPVKLSVPASPFPTSALPLFPTFGLLPASGLPDFPTFGLLLSMPHPWLTALSPIDDSTHTRVWQHSNSTQTPIYCVVLFCNLVQRKSAAPAFRLMLRLFVGRFTFGVDVFVIRVELSALSNGPGIKINNCTQQKFT